jgi:hypothetical protein
MGIILDQLFDIALPPSLPADLKAKKLNLKILKAKTDTPEEEKQQSPQEILDQIEDDLINEGLLDIDVEYEPD